MLSKISCITLLRNISPVSDVLFQVFPFCITPLETFLPVMLFHFEHLSWVNMLLLEYLSFLKFMYITRTLNLLFKKKSQKTLYWSSSGFCQTLQEAAFVDCEVCGACSKEA